MKWYNNCINCEPPISFGGLSFRGNRKSALFSSGIPFVQKLLLIFLSLWSVFAHSALLITQDPVVLNWDSAVLPLSKNVTVLRYERIGFYHYDSSSPSVTLNVWQNQFANQDSLTGTPSALGDTPAPFDAIGQPISINGAVPLSEADTYQYQSSESFFIVAEGPILPASSFATRISDGRRYVAVTIDVDNGDSHIITLVETTNGSGIYVGFLQANTVSSPIVIPDGSTLTIRYDNNGDVADSDTVNSPWFVNPLFLSSLSSERRGVMAPIAPPAPTDLFLTKQAMRNSVSTGDFLAYELLLENIGATNLTNIDINDVLPAGFRFQENSTRVNALPAANPVITNGGQQLTFNIASLNVGETVSLRYVVEVGAGVKDKKAINIAQASSGVLFSNQASAEVLVENPFFNDRAFLIGRVMVGSCNAENAEGLEGVRIYMEDGTNVITDKHGRWHIEGVMPGTHVLQLDTMTLDPRYSIEPCEQNTRKAGNLESRFVNVQGGTLWRENWYVRKNWSTDSNIEQQLNSEYNLETETVHVEIPVRFGDKKFTEAMTRVFVPEFIEVVPGSAKFNGKSIPDLKQLNDELELFVKPKGYFSKYTLELDFKIKGNIKNNEEFDLIAESSGVTDTGKVYSVTSKNRLEITGINENDNEIVLRPQFASMSTDLSEEDKKRISDLVTSLKNRKNLYLKVVGYSDSQKMRYRAGRAFNNNYELSELRARSVAEYLAELLELDMSKITIEGKGPENPVASNATADGRAKNRRVNLYFRYSEKVGQPVLGVAEGYSGINGDDDQEKAKLREEGIKISKAGFVNIHDGMTFIQPVFSATALVDQALSVKLLIDGKEVSDGKIGMRQIEPLTKMVRYTWVGLELEQVGDHDVVLMGLDRFGVERFSQAIALRRSGSIKTIVVENQGENIADGRSPVSIQLKLLDEFNKPITSQVGLKIESGSLKALRGNELGNPLEDKQNIVKVDASGWVYFEPVSHAGNYQIRLADDEGLSENIEVSVSPELREWILVGFAEGTAGYQTLKGNMQSLSNEEDHGYFDGNASFFARGKVKGEWLLTMAYDTRRDEEDNPLMQRIDPQRWYVLYGDDTFRSHDAPSREKLYLRIEKSDFYALFGDYDTGLNVTELTRYQRTLTGAKVHQQGRNVSFTAFASQTEQGFIREDIPADGTSGLYRLSNTNLIPGSETVSIEVRDRFTNEVLSTQAMMPYTDYSIDYFDGTLYFRQPIFVQDANFNPQRIVVVYEMSNASEELIGGGRVSVHDAEKKIEVGVTGIDDNTLGAGGDLSGLDVTWKPNEAHEVKAELALSHNENLSPASDTAQAALVEYVYKSEKIDSRIRVKQEEESFGLGQQALDDTDTRDASVNTRYRINEQFNVSADLSRQEKLTTEDQRDVVETRLEYQDENWKTFGGIRHAEDQIGVDAYQSEQLIAGTQRQLMDKRLVLFARGETSIDDNENIDYPNLLSLGSDYKVNSRFSVFANQDFSWGEERKTQDSRVGVRAIPWKGGMLTSDVSRTQDEFGPRLLAHAGLFQSVPVNNEWTADFGVDRSQTINGNAANPQFDPNQPLTQGTGNDDYTTVSTGLGYKTAQWQWSNRVELRRADTDDKVTFLSGIQKRVDEIDTIAARILHFDQRMVSGNSNRSSAFDLSYVRRPLDNDWVYMNRISFVSDELRDALGTQQGRRVVDNLNFNFIPSVGHQVALQYGLRYVKDTIDDERYIGFTDLIGIEYRYDISSQWDLGVRGSTLASWNSNQRMNSFGVMIGHSPIKDVWVSLGYNFEGFYDSDFTGAGTRIEGIVLDFKIKVDQDSAKTLVANFRNDQEAINE